MHATDGASETTTQNTHQAGVRCGPSRTATSPSGPPTAPENRPSSPGASTADPPPVTAASSGSRPVGTRSVVTIPSATFWLTTAALTSGQTTHSATAATIDNPTAIAGVRSGRGT